ncbi:hypothetical protein BU17DRAFT_88872 [Hysterangium stoloniferum]|nr:hypothetical protein BU17DRAFT_88872 [Hysterangium stoloniferum]
MARLCHLSAPHPVITPHPQPLPPALSIKPMESVSPFSDSKTRDSRNVCGKGKEGQATAGVIVGGPAVTRFASLLRGGIVGVVGAVLRSMLGRNMGEKKRPSLGQKSAQKEGICNTTSGVNARNEMRRVLMNLRRLLVPSRDRNRGYEGKYNHTKGSLRLEVTETSTGSRILRETKRRRGYNNPAAPTMGHGNLAVRKSTRRMVKSKGKSSTAFVRKKKRTEGRHLTSAVSRPENELRRRRHGGMMLMNLRRLPVPATAMEATTAESDHTKGSLRLAVTETGTASRILGETKRRRGYNNPAAPAMGYGNLAVRKSTRRVAKSKGKSSTGTLYLCVHDWELESVLQSTANTTQMYHDPSANVNPASRSTSPPADYREREGGSIPVLVTPLPTNILTGVNGQE